MKERPILFSAPMVRAILAGRKTQTRRVIPADIVGLMDPPRGQGDVDAGYPFYETADGEDVSVKDLCRYGRAGDLLWVRETWQYADWTEDGEPFIRYAADELVRLCRVNSDEWGEKITDIWAKLSEPENYNIDNVAADRKWRPSIFMPRWAGRLGLRVESVRVEKLQEISEEDAKSEGAQPYSYSWPDGSAVDQACDVGGKYRNGFRNLWDSINAKRGLSWSDNPWVWAVEFELLEK